MFLIYKWIINIEEFQVLQIVYRIINISECGNQYERSYGHIHNFGLLGHGLNFDDHTREHGILQ